MYVGMSIADLFRAFGGSRTAAARVGGGFGVASVGLASLGWIELVLDWYWMVLDWYWYWMVLD